MIAHLRASSWLDSSTAALVAEIILINVNINVMTTVRVLVEVPMATGLYPQVHVSTFRPYPYVDAFDFIFLLVQVLWTCYVIFLLVRLVRNAKKTRGEFVKDGWNFVEIIIVLLSLVSTALFAMRSYTTVKSVEEIKNNKGKIYITVCNLD